MLVGDGNPVTLPQCPDFLHCGRDHTDVNIATADAAPERFSCNIQGRATITVENGSDEKGSLSGNGGAGIGIVDGKRPSAARQAWSTRAATYDRSLSSFQTLHDRRRVPAPRYVIDDDRLTSGMLAFPQAHLLWQRQKPMRKPNRTWRSLGRAPVISVKPLRALTLPSAFRRRFETFVPGLLKCGVLVALNASARN
jgi:hypothetical protein